MTQTQSARKLDGIVKFYNKDKGHGVITYDGGEVRVERSGIKAQSVDHIADGEQVTFALTDGRNGPEAVQVEVILSA